MGWLSGTDYIKLETFMGCDARSGLPGTAACRWTLQEEHPILSPRRLRMAAACLNYGQAYVNHVATQETLIGLVQEAASKVTSGHDSFRFREWTLPVKDLRFVLWPWNKSGDGVEGFRELEFPLPARKYSCTVKKFTKGSLYAQVKWTPGYENIFAPACGLIPLAFLSDGLNSQERKTLAAALTAMNGYWATAAASVGSDREAFRKALVILQGAS